MHCLGSCKTSRVEILRQPHIRTLAANEIDSVTTIFAVSMLNEGLCQPRVALYWNDIWVFQKRHHYHVVQMYQDKVYTVEDVSDAHLNDVVGGALDRLHYAHDPCLQFDRDRKLWVYLHRERDEVDIEDDGTLSTKRRKKQNNEYDKNLMPDMKELRECFDGEQD
uniref:Nuclear factor related to kappa-B-binding protein second winged helix domain-containing protein n=1 Tax=Tanacetum cinerariifolium TaxID=118510 RepID=A0A6L2KLH9_TANCI|nr:hypothetical protein [Tanacetum cinerariifolium]